VSTPQRQPFIVRAKLTRKITEDGLTEVHEHVPIGTMYLIDLNTAEDMPLFNTQYHIAHIKRLVREYETGGYLPLECLEVLP
jgi:hypothetical protein